LLVWEDEGLMGGNSKIEWTERTWNPIVGCSIVSPGCTNCYAMKMAARIEAMRNQARYAGTTKKVNGNAVWTGLLSRAPEATLLEPLRRKRPTTYFVNSMGDLFHEDCPDEWIDRVFAVMALCPQHTFQVLTKRAGRMRDYFGSNATHTRIATLAMEMAPKGRDISAVGLVWAPHQMPNNYFQKWPMPNVWLGVSAERQQEANERVPLLLETPAAVRFVSAEPLLGHIAFHALNLHTETPSDALRGQRCVPDDSPEGYHNEPTAKLDWVIVGGESGPGARPMHPKWAKEIRDWCAASGVPYFFKQFGAWAPHEFKSNNSLKGEICIWPDGRTGRGSANDNGGGGAEMDRVGKKKAGRLLDGVEHNGMPG
jgi:protein gp37